MKTRHVEKQDQCGLDIAITDFIAAEDFKVDDHEGSYAVAAVGYPRRGACVSIGWTVGAVDWEVVKDCSDIEAAHLILLVLSPTLCVSGLLAVGFRHVMGQ